MKILYYSNPHMADCDFPLVKAMMENGHDVTYLIELTEASKNSALFNIKHFLPISDIIPATSYPELKFYEQYMDMSNVFIRNSTVKKTFSIDNLKLTWKTFKFVLNGKYDIIHRIQVFFLLDIVFYYFRNKLVKTVHDPFTHTGESLKGITLFFYNLGMKLFKKFVLLNNNQLGDFCEVYNIKRDNILLTRLGIYETINLFIPEHSKEVENNVLFFGRISPYKGVEYLCQAMEIVHEVIPDATLTIAGSGKFHFDISKYEKLPYIDIQNRYISMSELAELLKNCSLSVAPYTDATQSGVIMTSFAMYKPVIASNVGGLSEMVTNGETGVLLPPRDINALAVAIINLLLDDKKRYMMTQNIKSDYKEGDNSWNSIAEKYTEFYRKILR